MCGMIGQPDFGQQVGRAIGQGDLDLCDLLTATFHAAPSVDELVDGFAAQAMHLPRPERRSLALFLGALFNRVVEQDMIAAGVV